MTKTEMPEECEGCGYETEDLTAYIRRLKAIWLCKCCEGTHQGMWKELKREADASDVSRALSYIGNVILDAIKELKNDT